MKKYYPCLAAVVIITVVFGTIYITSQQTLRLSAYDPETGIAEAVATTINANGSPSSFNLPAVNINSDLRPFVIVYDRSGKPIAGYGYINNKFPAIPIGALRHATSGQDNLITWQPQSGVRVATAIVATQNYYVVGGRSLRQVEKREMTVLKLAAFGWLVSLAALCGAYVLTNRSSLRRGA